MVQALMGWGDGVVHIAEGASRCRICSREINLANSVACCSARGCGNTPPPPRFWCHTSGVSCGVAGRQPEVQLLSTVWHLMRDIRSSSSPKSVVALWALGLHRRVSFRKCRKIRDPTHYSLSMRVSFSCVRYLIACFMVALQRHILYGNGDNFITFCYSVFSLSTFAV